MIPDEDNWNDFPGLAEKNLNWIASRAGEKHILFVLESNSTWKIRLNDFPEEPMYTLIVEEEEMLNFTDWPDSWKKVQP